MLQTYSYYVILIASPLQQSLHESPSTLRHAYIACLVGFFLILYPCFLIFLIISATFIHLLFSLASPLFLFTSVFLSHPLLFLFPYFFTKLQGLFNPCSKWLLISCRTCLPTTHRLSREKRESRSTLLLPYVSFFDALTNISVMAYVINTSWP